MARALAAAVSGQGVVDPSRAVIAADDEGFARGRAAFETLRVYAAKPFRLEEHLQRLATSASRLELEPPSVDELRELAVAAVAAAGVPDVVLRLYWTPGGADGGRAIALASEIPDWIEPARERGQRVVSLAYPRRSLPWLLPGTKSVSYAAHIAAELEAKRRGADDAVFVDLDTIVLEGPVTNVWWREGGTLLTPGLELGILAGETRAALLSLAKQLGYTIETGSYAIERLRAADEAFTSSSVREVMPLAAVDGHEYTTRDAAALLQTSLRELALG